MAYLLNKFDQRIGKGRARFVNCCYGNGVRCSSFMLCKTVNNSPEKEDLEKYF